MRNLSRLSQVVSSVLRVGLVGLLVTGVSAACGEDPEEVEKECRAIEADIRTTAMQRGIATQGVCVSTNPAVQRDFGEACARLKDCNKRLDEAR